MVMQRQELKKRGNFFIGVTLLLFGLACLFRGIIGFLIFKEVLSLNDYSLGDFLVGINTGLYLWSLSISITLFSLKYHEMSMTMPDVFCKMKLKLLHQHVQSRDQWLPTDTSHLAQNANANKIWMNENNFDQVLEQIENKIVAS